MRKVPGRAGATKVQIAERRAGRDVVLEHIGTAHDGAELAVLMDLARCLAPGLMEALNPREDESHGGTEEVPGGAPGPGTGAHPDATGRHRHNQTAEPGPDGTRTPQLRQPAVTVNDPG